MIEKKVEPQWMVLARHFGMSGGIIDYGEATIEEFFDTLQDADEYAKSLFENTADGLVDPRVWVLKCERTYVHATEGSAVIVS